MHSVHQVPRLGKVLEVAAGPPVRCVVSAFSIPGGGGGVSGIFRVCEATPGFHSCRDSYSTYEEALKPLFPETRKRVKVAVSSIYITTQHGTLLERLQDLREKVQEKLDAAAPP
ncbi:hypothetical protein MRX96_014686 [Rhipicephalus microplus]